MTDETIHQFLQRRRRVLAAQMSALMGQLRPIEAELAEIEKMSALLQDQPQTVPVESPQPVTGTVSVAPGLPPAVSNAAIGGALGLDQFTAQPPFVLMQKYVQMTIKELAIQALVDHFPRGGTLAEIRDYIRDGFGRVIEPSSLRPQMHRLKADGILMQDTSTDIWNLNPHKRTLYAMYDHPTSRAVMKELQDDPEAKSLDELVNIGRKPSTRLKDMK